MSEKEFLKWCKKEVCEFINSNVIAADKEKINLDDVYMVWCCRTLQNNKALLSSTLKDNLYFECTYNGDKKEMYLDVYMKYKNICISNK